MADAARLIDPHIARALVEGRHADPFAVLGPHPFPPGSPAVPRQRGFAADDGQDPAANGGSLVLRVLVPGAERVEALEGDAAHGLLPVPGAHGLFAGTIGSRDYRLRAHRHGQSWDWDDPYRHGPVLGEIDEYLFGEGTHHRLWKVLGAAPIRHEGTDGTRFAVWAPNAERVSVVGDFNGWDGRRNVMRRRGSTGIWEIFLPGIGEGEVYKYEIRANGGRILPLKADPFGFGSEHPPRTGSVVRDITSAVWSDGGWLKRRGAAQSVDAPMSIYEVHLPSWRRADNGARPLSYLELADQLIPYVKEMGFTHIECLPVSEFPFDGSWGYQPIGLYAPTIRMGTPAEFRAFVDRAHRAGIGILLDWVPGHFPTDVHGLGLFDGTPLYEHADPKEGFHQDWNTLIYNYGRAEVANYLIANALYWLEEFHIDGLRVDAVASMLYRDYSRKSGEWVPNRDGGRENYEAISLLRRMNTAAYGEVPGIVTVAEESTAFPGVSAPADRGGLGFGYKWNMGWMNDTLRYMQVDPLYRQHHHGQMIFSIHYAFTENFILPISHDEVVHGKGSMLAKMPGDPWQKFANLRTYYGFMWGHPGKKLLFMGQEFAQGQEWNHQQSLDWHLLEQPAHAGMKRLVAELNRLYAGQPALHRQDCRPEGFQWLEAGDADRSIFAWIRRAGTAAGASGPVPGQDDRVAGTDTLGAADRKPAAEGQDGVAQAWQASATAEPSPGAAAGAIAADRPVVVALNMTPVPRPGYRLGLPGPGRWRVMLDTDAAEFGGSGYGADRNGAGFQAEPQDWMGQDWSAEVDIPPLATLFLVQEE